MCLPDAAQGDHGDHDPAGDPGEPMSCEADERTDDMGGGEHATEPTEDVDEESQHDGDEHGVEDEDLDEDGGLMSDPASQSTSDPGSELPDESPTHLASEPTAHPDDPTNRSMNDADAGVDRDHHAADQDDSAEDDARHDGGDAEDESALDPGDLAEDNLDQGEGEGEADGGMSRERDGSGAAQVASSAQAIASVAQDAASGLRVAQQDGVTQAQAQSPGPEAQPVLEQLLLGTEQIVADFGRLAVSVEQSLASAADLAGTNAAQLAQISASLETMGRNFDLAIGESFDALNQAFSSTYEAFAAIRSRVGQGGGAAESRRETSVDERGSRTPDRGDDASGAAPQGPGRPESPVEAAPR